MSKRKNSDDNYGNFLKKIKKLEREVYSSRRKRVRIMHISSSSSASPEPPPPSHHARRSKPRERQNDDSAAASRQINGPDDDIAALLCSSRASQARRPSPAAPRSQAPRAAERRIPTPPAVQRQGSPAGQRHLSPAVQRYLSPTVQRQVSPSSSDQRNPSPAAHCSSLPMTQRSLSQAAQVATETFPSKNAAAPIPTALATPAATSTALYEHVASMSAAESTAPSHAEQPTDVDALDDEIMEILGVDPTETVKFCPEIHKEVAIRFEHCATSGLTKEVRKSLTERHLIPSNCKLVDAPVLNPQTHGALSESVMKRDEAIEMKQKLIASAISSLGEAITMVLSLKEKQPDLLRLLIDTGRIICDCQHHDSQTKRNYVLSSIKKEWKEQMKTTKIDNFLFGQDLEDTLKTAKAINKFGADLKATNSFTKPKVNTKSTPATSKNWKNSNMNRKQTAAPKTKETTTVPTATKNPRASSYKPSRRPRSGRH